MMRARLIRRSLRGLSSIVFAAACSDPGGPRTAPVADVVVTVPFGNVLVGSVTQASAVLQDANGNTLTGREITWTSSNSLVAMVSGSGGITGVAPGSATITATSEGKSDFVTVTVVHGVAEVLVTLPQPGLAVGFTLQALATLKDASSSVLTGRTVVWSSSNTAVATVSPSGLVTGVGRGTAEIRLTSEGKTGSATIGVVAIKPQSLTVGASHVCALTVDGDAYCWGANYNGQAGINTFNSPRPLPVVGGLKFTALAAGFRVTFGLTTDGRLYCWGGPICDPYARVSPYDEFVGPATLAPIRVPTTRAIEILPNEVVSFPCAIGPGNVAYCWGTNNNGELGTGTTSPDTLLGPAAPVAGNHAFAQIASASHTCAITTEGRAYCWGPGSLGALGDGTGASSSVPRAVAGDHVFKDIGTGSRFSCGLTGAGAAYCWGDNSGGQLGTTTGSCLGGDTPCSATPVAVTGGHTFESISVGGGRACGVETATGDVYCWGITYGSAPTRFRSVLASESGGVKFRLVSVGSAVICATTTTGDIWCRGANNIGQLGNGTTTSPSEPTSEPSLVVGGITFRAP